MMQCSEKGARFNGQTIESVNASGVMLKQQNLDLLALRTIVSIKNRKTSGLRLYIVYLMSTVMIFITKLDLGKLSLYAAASFGSLSFFLSISAFMYYNHNLHVHQKEFKACHRTRSEIVFLLHVAFSGETEQNL